MTDNLRRMYVVELVGSFGLVFFSAGAVCMNYLAVPANQPLGTTPLNVHQSGLVGIALVQGLMLAVLLALTVPISGGYLNPAITIMLWVFRRLDARRVIWLVGAQLMGAFLAGTALRITFDKGLLEFAHFGTPHLNLLAYHELSQGALAGGTAIELVLTFFLVFAMFGAADGKGACCAGGAVVAAAVLVSFPVTGAALNPARWFGTVIWEKWALGSVLGRSPFDDVLVYLAGPILGALLGGAFSFLVYLPGRQEKRSG
jgi:glycerol uptake facilitator-like aquaporin